MSRTRSVCRILSLLLSAVLLLGALPAALAAPADPADPAKPLKILAIGNSYSNNATEYLYKVFAAEGYENVILGRLYHSGCSLQQHVTYLQTDAKEYNYYKNTDDAWVSHANSTMLDGLLDEDWDIITMQQSSTYSGRPDSYSYLDTLVDFVNEKKTNPDAVYYWHMTWAWQGNYTGNSAYSAYYGSDQMTMYGAITGAVTEKILPRDDFVGVIPSGTAIQNARSSFIGDNLNSDGTHLNDVGRLIAAYVWFCKLTGRTSLSELKFTAINGTPLSASWHAPILEAINNALADPMRRTPSAYPPTVDPLAQSPCDGSHEGWTPIGSWEAFTAACSRTVEGGYKYYMLAPGRYRLTADLVCPASIALGADTALCLNGHTLSASATSGGLSWFIGAWGTSGAHSVLCDCTGEGAIRHNIAAASSPDGNGVTALSVSSAGTCDLFDVNITESLGRYSVVWVNAGCTLNMYGGSIKNNSAASTVGGVYVQAASSESAKSGAFNLFSGEVSGNTAGTAAERNVFVHTTAYGQSQFRYYGGTAATAYGPVIYPVRVNDQPLTATLSHTDPRLYADELVTYSVPDAVLTLKDAPSITSIEWETGTTLTLKPGEDRTDWAGLNTVLGAAAGTPLILDLDGHTVRNTNTGSMNNLNIYGDVTIRDSSSAGGGSLDGYRLLVNGKLTLEAGAAVTGGFTTGTYGGGGVCVSTGGRFTMNGGSVSGNTSNGAGAGVCVAASDGAFIMNGGSISGNTAKTSGGGVYVTSGGTFTMNGGSISGNTAVSGGGCAVYNGSMLMQGGSVTGNTATHASSTANGGGIHVTNLGRLTLSGGVVSDNEAKTNGRDVMLISGANQSGACMTMTGGTVGNGTASRQALALYTAANKFASLDLTGGDVAGSFASSGSGTNTVTVSGGARVMCLSTGAVLGLTVSGGSFGQLAVDRGLAGYLAQGKALLTGTDPDYPYTVGDPVDGDPGDLNGDGKVNGKDAVMLQRFVAGGYGVQLAEDAADLTGDGKVNAKDVVLLQRFLAGGYGVSL